MEIAERAARFQALHERDQPFVVANPWDVGSARLFEAVGYEALATTGGGRAFSLGLPDGSTTPEQLFDYIAEITASTSLGKASRASLTQSVYTVSSFSLTAGEIRDQVLGDAQVVHEVQGRRVPGRRVRELPLRGRAPLRGSAAPRG